MILRTEYAAVKSLMFQPNFHWLQSLSTQSAKATDWTDPMADIRAVLE